MSEEKLEDGIHFTEEGSVLVVKDGELQCVMSVDAYEKLRNMKLGDPQDGPST